MSRGLGDVYKRQPQYWERIGTMLIAGDQIEGVDTGYRRIELIQAQLRMHSNHPLGCGHRCTAILSPRYLDDTNLTGPEGERARSSHNTFMTLLVEQGLPGAAFYILWLLWLMRISLLLRKRLREETGLMPYAFAGALACLGAIVVGDQFVDYLKFEIRVWFIAILLVLVRLTEPELTRRLESEVPALEKRSTDSGAAPSRPSSVPLKVSGPSGQSRE